MQTMTLTYNDVDFLFERHQSDDEMYICSCLATIDDKMGNNNKLVVNIFKDELVLTQCEVHLHAGKGDDVEFFLTFLATVITAVENNFEELGKLVNNAKAKREKARQEFREKYK